MENLEYATGLPHWFLLIVVIFGFIWAVLWLVMPFLVFDIRNASRKSAETLKDIHYQLALLNNQVENLDESEKAQDGRS